MVNLPEGVSRDRREVLPEREAARDGLRPHLAYTCNRSSGEGESQAVRGEKRLNLEDCMGLEKRSRGVRGNTLYVERIDWCRKSDTGW